jgi:hypothetical protein
VHRNECLGIVKVCDLIDASTLLMYYGEPHGVHEKCLLHIFQFIWVLIYSKLMALRSDCIFRLEENKPPSPKQYPTSHLPPALSIFDYNFKPFNPLCSGSDVPQHSPIPGHGYLNGLEIILAELPGAHKGRSSTTLQFLHRRQES